MKLLFRHIVVGLLLGLSCWVVSTPGLAQAGAANKAGTSKKKVAAKPSPALVHLTWTLVEHTFNTGMDLAKDLLIHEASQPLSSLTARSRNQWNGGSIIRFAQAYDFYAKKLTDDLDYNPTLWLKWQLRLKNLKKAGLALRQSALEGKASEALRTHVQELKSWKPLNLGKAPAKATHSQLGLLMNTVSGLSTGIEFATFHRIHQLQGLLKKDTAKHIKELKALLGNIKFYRRLFKALRKMSGKQKWIPLFVYHAELMYRTTAYLGLSVLKKGAKKTRFAAKYTKYNNMLKASLGKANTSFAKFWRP